MMENRSFDHMLGYLSLPNFGGVAVDGLRDDKAFSRKLANSYGGVLYPLHYDDNPFRRLAGDPPHERDDIANQMGTRTNGENAMDGFVANFAKAKSKPLIDKDHLPPVMGYFTSGELPISDFFARHFCVCDHWFSAIPAGTQPNRLMAMSGTTLIDKNVHILPYQPLVYDWLSERGISWRVYHEGMPFFTMMLKWTEKIFDNNLFRTFDRLIPDIEEAAEGEMPQVIFLEPAYTDAPHIGPSSDDHAPSGASAGQEFLMKVYNAITTDPDLWKNSVTIITYDEHGGFFDHVSPPDLITKPVASAYFDKPFETLGVRVPGFVISPFVDPGKPYTGIMDHTSILKLLGQCFDKKGIYSEEVSLRKIASVVDVLDFTQNANSPGAPNLIGYLGKAEAAGRTNPSIPPDGRMEESFQTALDAMHAHSAADTAATFPDLVKFVTRV